MKNTHLPTGWQEFKLKDILANEKYSMKRGPFGSSLKKEFFVKEGIKVFEQYNPINNDPYWCRYRITKEKYSELSAFKCKAGDFLVSCSGTLGKIILLPDDVEEGIINQALLKIRLNNDIIDNKYFLNLFQSKIFQDKIYSDARGGAIQNVASIDEIKLIHFILPPLDEQKRIAEVLSLCDDIIENLTELIDKKEQYKKGVMQRVLSGEVRFKGFTDEWKTVKLLSVVKIQNGYAFKSGEFQKSGIPIIRISNISNETNYMDMEDLVYYNKIEKDEAFTILKNDLLIAMSGATAGKTSIYNLDTKAYLNQRVGVFRIIDDKKIDNRFLSQYVFSYFFSSQLKPFLIGGAQPNISAKDIENILIILPSLEEQRKIGEFLSTIDNEIDNLKKQLELRKQQKKGLMQKLLTGEVRV